MKKLFKKLIIRFCAILCSALLLVLSPFTRYIGASNIENVQATELVLELVVEEGILEYILAYLATLALGEAAYEARDVLWDSYSEYVKIQINNNQLTIDTIQDTCLLVYDKSNDVIHDFSWQDLINGLREQHDIAVDNLTDLYIKYCPQLLVSFDDFVTNILNGDVYVSGLSDAIVDYTPVAGADITAQWSGEPFNYRMNIQGQNASEFYILSLAESYISSDPIAMYFTYRGPNMYSPYFYNFLYRSTNGRVYDSWMPLYLDNYSDGIITKSVYKYTAGIGPHFDTTSISISANFPVFSSEISARSYLEGTGPVTDALNYDNSMYSAITDNADFPLFYRTWQQEELERLRNTTNTGIGSYGRGISTDKWDDEIPWINLYTLRQYAHSLLDIYNQIINDIINGQSDSSNGAPDTYSDAWEQAVSDAWDNMVEKSDDAGPADGNKDNTTEEEEDKDKDKDNPPEGGGGDGNDNNNKDDEKPDPKEPPEENGNEDGTESLYDEDGNYTGGRSQEELDELANDPAHSGSARPSDIEKGLHEREIGLDLEERGELARPIVRDPSGAAEFIDGNGQAWDVKSFHSDFPTDNGGYTLLRSMKAISESLEAGEHVILDTSYLNEADLAELLNEIFEKGLIDYIIVWP